MTGGMLPPWPGFLQNFLIVWVQYPSPHCRLCSLYPLYPSYYLFSLFAFFTSGFGIFPPLPGLEGTTHDPFPCRLPSDLWPSPVSGQPIRKSWYVWWKLAYPAFCLPSSLTQSAVGLPSASLQASTAAVLTFREQRRSWLQVASVNAERKCLFDLAENVLFLLDPCACFLLSLRLRSFGKFWSLCIALLQATCGISRGFLTPGNRKSLFLAFVHLRVVSPSEWLIPCAGCWWKLNRTKFWLVRERDIWYWVATEKNEVSVGISLIKSFLNGLRKKLEDRCLREKQQDRQAGKPCASRKKVGEKLVSLTLPWGLEKQGESSMWGKECGAVEPS